MKVFYGIVLGLFFIPLSNLPFYSEDEALSPNKDWYFSLVLEPGIALKYKMCTYYPEYQRLSCIHKDGKASKEKKNVYVQPSIKPKAFENKDAECSTAIKIYGYYVDKNTNIKYWVWKFSPKKKNQAK